MRIPGWLLIVGVIGFVLSTAICSVASFALAREAATTIGSELAPGFVAATQPPTAVSVAQNAPTATPPPTLEPGVTPSATPNLPTPTTDPMAALPRINDPRRITILLLGIDQRTDVSDESENTDTLMLISIDPVRNTAGVLSIPRDLWVTIPGYAQPGRINTAYPRGQNSAYPGGGGALAVETVETNLGVDIDGYVLVNFQVFYTVVDALAPDGVNICVRETIHDEAYPDNAYGTITVHFDPGCQRLDSVRLLQYARTRHTQGGDFDRAQRQQEVLRAFREEILGSGLTNTVLQIPILWEQLADNVVTDLTLEQVMALASEAAEIERDSIRFGAIGPNDVSPAMSADGTQEILVPRQNRIRYQIEQVFNPPQNLTLADYRQRAENEDAEIFVYNNTNVAGLAGQLRDYLTAEGVSIATVGNMPSVTEGATQIRDYTGNPWTAQYLARILGLPDTAIVPGMGDGLISGDILIVVGTDIQPLLGAAPAATP
jgi:polyisoprenyl-teichoic acid--peptidoglycan teichoic acid transferase